MQFRDLGAHLRAGRRFQAGERLVEHEHLRLKSERAGDREALAVFAKGIWFALQQLLEPEDSSRLRHPFFYLRVAKFPRFQPESDVVMD